MIDIKPPPVLSKRAAKRHRQRLNCESKRAKLPDTNNTIDLKQKLKAKLDHMKSSRFHKPKVNTPTKADIISDIQSSLSPDVQGMLMQMVQSGKIKDLATLQGEVAKQKSLVKNK